jgi:hypothetical protein
MADATDRRHRVGAEQYKGELAMSDTEQRIREKAQRLWKEAGRPSSGVDAYMDQASELVAIEHNLKDTLRSPGVQPRDAVEDDPIASDDVLGPEGEPVEPLVAVVNEGEFPTLTDQGEQQVPHWPGQKVK